ncbi:MAG: C-GCAxxG-C-C family protein [Promethearchaeota archaeon]
MNNVENAVSCFKTKFNCSQAIFSTYGPKLGIDRGSCLKIAEIFGGGMAYMGNVCGAVTGAFMVIGLKYGRKRDNDEQAKEKAYDAATRFVEEFKTRNGTIMCRELIDFDLSTPEQRELAREKNIFDKCQKFVQDSAEILEKIIS